MKLVKTASGKQTIKMSKSEWEALGKQAGWMNEDYVTLEEARELTREPDEVDPQGAMTDEEYFKSQEEPDSFDRWEVTSDWEDNVSSPVTTWFTDPELAGDEELAKMKAAVSPDEYGRIADMLKYMTLQKIFDISLAKTENGWVISLDYGPVPDKKSTDRREKEFPNLESALETLAQLINY